MLSGYERSMPGEHSRAETDQASIAARELYLPNIGSLHIWEYTSYTGFVRRHDSKGVAEAVLKVGPSMRRILLPQQLASS